MGLRKGSIAEGATAPETLRQNGPREKIRSGKRIPLWGATEGVRAEQSVPACLEISQVSVTEGGSVVLRFAAKASLPCTFTRGGFEP
ncbi:hypothetical protein MCEMSEM23_00160 [Rhabdaerophilaceae bacterium]